jgi:hypothetical protein
MSGTDDVYSDAAPQTQNGNGLRKQRTLSRSSQKAFANASTSESGFELSGGAKSAAKLRPWVDPLRHHKAFANASTSASDCESDEPATSASVSRASSKSGGDSSETPSSRASARVDPPRHNRRLHGLQALSQKERRLIFRVELYSSQTRTSRMKVSFKYNCYYLSCTMQKYHYHNSVLV